MLRKSLSSFLCLLYISGGVLMFSPAILDIHRNLFEDKVNTMSGAVVFAYTNSEFKQIKWTRQDREFDILGKLYDVKSMARTATGVIIQCVNDETEESLVAIFNTWKKSLPFCKSKIRLHPPLLENNVLETTSFGIVTSDFICDNFRRYGSQFIELTSPPPEKES